MNCACSLTDVLLYRAIDSNCGQQGRFSSIHKYDIFYLPYVKDILIKNILRQQRRQQGDTDGHPKEQLLKKTSTPSATVIRGRQQQLARANYPEQTEYSQVNNLRAKGASRGTDIYLQTLAQEGLNTDYIRGEYK